MQPESDVSTFRCGSDTVSVRSAGDELHMTIRGETFTLIPVAAASGARFVAADDPDTSFWNKGDRALVEVRGAALPECALTHATEPTSQETPYRARGNEPGWHVDIGANAIVLVTHYGAQRLTAPKPAVAVANATRRYATQVNGHTLRMEIAPGPCVDTMSGMPYPDTVTVQLNQETLRGCGGDPATLLTGGEWLLQDMPGGIAAGTRGTLRFDPAGRVSGEAFCNRFGGPYTLTGETLTIGPLAATKMACEPPRMEQEQRFLALLEAVVGFAVEADGAVTLRTRDDGWLRLQR